MPSPTFVAANLIATLWVAAGLNAVLRPVIALSYFEFPYPTGAEDAALVNNLLAVYGVRDIFMGVALYVAAIWGTPKSLGWTTIAASAVAAADGYICYANGAGEWNHWGYAPMLTVVGGLLVW